MVFHWRLPPTRKSGFKVSHLRYAFKIQIQCLTTVKLPGSFRLAASNLHLYRFCIFTERLLETVLQSLSLSCGPELTWQGITLPLDDYGYRRRLLVLRTFSPYLAAWTDIVNIPALVRPHPLYILLRVKQGVVFLINSRLRNVHCGQ